MALVAIGQSDRSMTGLLPASTVERPGGRSIFESSLRTATLASIIQEYRQSGPRQAYTRFLLSQSWS